MSTIRDFFDPTNPEHLKGISAGESSQEWHELCRRNNITPMRDYLEWRNAARKLADHCLAQIEAKPQPKDADKLWEFMEAHGNVTHGRDITDEGYSTLQIDSSDFDRAVEDYNDDFASKAKPQPAGESVTIRAVVFNDTDGDTVLFGYKDEASRVVDMDTLDWARHRLNSGNVITPIEWLNIRVPLPQVPTVEVEAEVEDCDVQ